VSNTPSKHSADVFRRAQQVIPGGVNSPARAFGAVGGSPPVIRQGHGSRIVDLDGNERIDYVCSWGPLILGHCHPAVVEAVTEALGRGASFGAGTEAEVELAELIVEAVPSIEQVRMVNSGTEAAASAIRLARGFTGRDCVIKFEGCYHGHVDSLLVQAGSAATTLGVPSSPGVPAGCTQDTLLCRYNDIGQVADLLKQHEGQVAAIIVEPVAGNMGVVPGNPGFLEGLRVLASEQGVVLIFDEVITGFRLSYGGAQALLGIQPDLTILGKIVGGGLPVGAYGGRREIMQSISPTGPVFQAGTLSGNPLATAAGAATLRQLRDGKVYQRIEAAASRLAAGLHEAAQAAGIAHHLARVGSMMTLFFTPDPVTDYEAACRSDTTRFATWFWAMMNRGVYLPCSQFEAVFVSAAHTEADIDTTLAAVGEAMAEIA